MVILVIGGTGVITIPLAIVLYCVMKKGALDLKRGEHLVQSQCACVSYLVSEASPPCDLDQTYVLWCMQCMLSLHMGNSLQCP